MLITSGCLPRSTIVAAFLIAGGVAVSTVVHAAVEQSDPPRSELFIGLDACPGEAGGGAISVSYDDLVDGHAPQAVTEVLADQSGELWRTSEVHHVDGDYFNVHNFPATAAIPITDDSEFTYTLTIAYEDGVSQTQSVSLSVADECASGSPSTTTSPTTTAPSGNRFGLSRTAASCNDGPASASISYGFTDTADDHVPAEFAFQLVEGDRLWGHYDGPVGADGQTFDVTVPGPLFAVNRLEAATYTLVVWVKYEDGVVESHRLSYDVAAVCDLDDPTTTTPSTTSPPSGTLPQTR